MTSNTSKFSRPSPPCAHCLHFKPTVNGWRCFSLVAKRVDEPEEILDTESGNCGAFVYRSTRLQEEPDA